MLTIKAEIKKSEARVDGSFNVKLRFTLNRQVKRISTSIFIGKADLTRNLQFKEGTLVKNQIDELVNSYRQRCSALQVDINSYSLDDIFELLSRDNKANQEIDFILFSQCWIENCKAKGKKNYQSALNAFIKYIGTPHIDIKKVNKRILSGFLQFLNDRQEKKQLQLAEQGKRVPSNRATSLYLGSLRHLFNEAQKEFNDYEKDLICIPYNPFNGFQIPKQEATRKRALPPNLVKAIWELPYQTYRNGKKKHNRFNLAKDCFILSFCLIGMNSVDLYSLQEMEGDLITYYRTKTKGRRLDKAKMVVKIPKIILPILDFYSESQSKRTLIFHRKYSTASSFNRAINLGLKEIGTLLNIQDLEFYAARHSWATIALNKCKIDKYTVHAALNHIDESMKITDIYIERDFIVENEANAKVIQYVFDK